MPVKIIGGEGPRPPAPPHATALHSPFIPSAPTVFNFTIPMVWRQIGDKIDTQISWPWKHFFASKIVLRVIVCCLGGVGSMSSNRHIPRLIVLFSSGHRWLFFVASLWAYVVVASFLCLRVVGSSFRRLRYILGQVLDVWGHIHI